MGYRVGPQLDSERIVHVLVGNDRQRKRAVIRVEFGFPEPDPKRGTSPYPEPQPIGIVEFLAALRGFTSLAETFCLLPLAFGEAIAAYRHTAEVAFPKFEPVDALLTDTFRAARAHLGPGQIDWVPAGTDCQVADLSTIGRVVQAITGPEVELADDFE